ncbi:unnamed protein product [marine sediment metagenome]|uniref:Uncharacterized protein n=1 Tax=marine sediment metagenome TaxID=412755 RepID=X1FVI9_9ZZZZ
MVGLTTQGVKTQLKQFHDRQGDEWVAWIFCWGYLVALKHSKLITEEQYKILDKINTDLLK